MRKLKLSYVPKGPGPVNARGRIRTQVLLMSDPTLLTTKSPIVPSSTEANATVAVHRHNEFCLREE